MKKNLTNILLVAFILFWGYSMYFRKESSEGEAIKEIRLLKEEIVRLDSLQRSEMIRQIDSMKLGAGLTQDQIKKIELINKKLQQQNEKLDKIYNSVHVDLPDL